MIETVVALLMFVNAEIKEARLQKKGMAQCLRGKRHAEREYSENCNLTNAGRVKAELEFIILMAQNQSRNSSSNK